MKCPVINIDVGNKCPNHSCWLWHHNAKGNCVADDVGNTHILPIDVARIYNESIEATNERIERGRKKMAAWLALLEKLEETKDEGCSACGAPKCNQTENCLKRQHKISRLKKNQLPFEQFVKMSPSKWYTVLASYKLANCNAVMSINLKGYKS